MESPSPHPKSGLPDNFSLWLDAFRWMAAFAVVITHTGNRLLVYASSIPLGEIDPVHFAFAFLMGFAHQGVMIFFVISGFLVGGGLYRDFTKGKPSLGEYLAKRLLRLWIVIIPALVFALGLTYLGLAAYPSGGTGIYSANVAEKLTPVAFLCNAAFLQTAACAPFADVGALWSLFNEFWYYIVFPLLLIALFPLHRGAARLAAGIAATVLLVALTYFQYFGNGGQATVTAFAPYMLMWLLGVVVAVRGRPFIRCPVPVAAALFVIALLAIRIGVRRNIDDYPVLEFWLDLLVVVLFANLLLALKLSRRLISPPGGRLHTHLAGFSFSLYCVHVAILNAYVSVAMGQLGYGRHMTTTGLKEWALVAGALVVAIGGGYAFSLLTEAHTDRVRRRVLGWLSLRRAQSLAAGDG